MDPRDDRPVHDVVRARRFELVDDEGRTRAVLGDLGSPDPEESVLGLSVLDHSGAPRISMGLGKDSTWLVLELSGNHLVQMGVNDPESDAVGALVFLYLCDADGVPVVGWTVAGDGGVTRGREQRTSPSEDATVHDS